MAKVFVLTAGTGSRKDYEESTRLIGLMKVRGVGPEYESPALNWTAMVDDDGRTWYGYDYDGASWWVTGSMAAEEEGNDPFEFTEQKDPARK